MWARWYGSIVERFREWAESDPDVRAALIVGSQARSDVPADEWSDLDLAIFHSEPARLIGSTDWFQRFGSAVLSMVESTAVGGSRERRVLFSDGKDVDFAIFPASAISSLTRSPEGRSVLGRGFVVLVDKDRGLTQLSSVVAGRTNERRALPPESKFQANVADFLYHVLWDAKKLRRGETWTAKMACDGYLKLLLVRMIEWSSLARESGTLDVWHDGRFLDTWAPADVKVRLAATFARYDPADLARALKETDHLYTDLARQVAGHLGWTYPLETEETVRKLVDRTLSGFGVPA
jgi:aminoglycoside 6-adenylyltransferase